MRTADNKRKKKKRGSLLALLLILLVLVGAALVALFSFIKVEYIEITGLNRYSAEEILTAGNIKKGDSLLALNSSKKADRIYDQLIYVGSVVIEKEYPATLRILVSEKEPVAGLEVDGSYWLISANGRYIENVPVLTDTGCFEIKGLSVLTPSIGDSLTVYTEEAARLKYLLTILGAVDSLSISDKIEDLDISNKNDIKFVFDDRFNIKLGSGEAAAEKIQLMVRVAAEKNKNVSGTIDLSKSGQASYIPG